MCLLSGIKHLKKTTYNIVPYSQRQRRTTESTQTAKKCHIYEPEGRQSKVVIAHGTHRNRAHRSDIVFAFVSYARRVSVCLFGWHVRAGSESKYIARHTTHHTQTPIMRYDLKGTPRAPRNAPAYKQHLLISILPTQSGYNTHNIIVHMLRVEISGYGKLQHIQTTKHKFNHNQNARMKIVCTRAQERSRLTQKTIQNAAARCKRAPVLWWFFEQKCRVAPLS